MGHSIPKRFRKELPQRKFEKRILGRVHLPKERQFLDSVFETTGEGTRRIPESLSEEDRAHLAKLAKDIKANRGSVRRVRIAALGIIVGGVVVFNLFFLDAFLEHAAERGLEVVFAARSEVDELDFSPLAGELTIAGVSVGDRRRPMRNLFELEALTASVNPVELLKGNVAIREASVATIRTGTARTTSAALPGAAGTDGDSGPEGPSVVDRAQDAAKGTFDGIGSLADPAALVEQELSNLESPALVEDIRAEYETFTDRWTERVGAIESTSEETVALAARVRDIDPAGLDTPQEIADALVLVREASQQVDSVLTDARELAGETREEYRAVESTLSRVQESLQRDFQYIGSRFSLDSVDVSGFVSGLAEEFLVRLLGEIYGTAQRGLDIAERLRQQTDDADAGDGISRAPGRVVTFPAVVYPRFLLQRAALGVEPGNLDVRLDGELTSVSSNPALVAEPTRLFLEGARGGTSLAAQSELSYENGRVDEILTTVSGTGLSFSSSEIPRLGALRSNYEFQTTLQLAAGGGATSQTTVELADLELDRQETDNLVVMAVQDVVAGLGTVDVDAEFTISEGSVRLDRLSTSADDAIRQGVASTLNARRDEYVARARAELEGRIEEELAELEPLRERAAGIRTEAERIRDALASRDRIIEEKRAELEERSRALAAEQRERVEDEARDRLEDATEDLDLDGLGF
jgi:uncharacterized protein (TIGR03545 family)